MPGLLTRRFDRMFDGLGPAFRVDCRHARPSRIADGGVIARADVPGFRPKEISIEVQAEMLTIAGRHEETKEEKSKHYLRHERRYGSFSRSPALPEGVDTGKISAQTHDGVLEVKVSRPEENAEQER
jgi:HSP20 family protein